MNHNEIFDAVKVTSEHLPAVPKFFNDLFELTIGNWMAYQNKANKIKYKQKLNEKINEIPKNKLTEPKLSIIGPALEASKYYIEEEEIRNLFSNLIASSMNSDSSDFVHHSFTEIIKQLSPYDANLFSSIVEVNPIVEIAVRKIDIGEATEHSIFFVTKEFSDYKKNAIALFNLQKQGLIEIFHEQHITYPNDAYARYYSHPRYLELKNSFYDNAEFEVLIKPKMFVITDLGRSFKSICCNQK